MYNDDFSVGETLKDNTLELTIKKKIEQDPFNYQACEDLFHILLLDYNRQSALWLRDHITSIMPKLPKSEIRQFYSLHEQVYLLLAPDHFESFMIMMEWDREMKKSFLRPRKKQLQPLIDNIQKLADDELDMLAISMPPGTGKTTLAIFLLTWFAGKYPDEPSLVGSHSAAIIRGMYEEILRMADKNGEYRWQQIFPNVYLSKTNAKDLRIDFGKAKRFETLQFTSIGAGNAGLYRARRLLYCDDLISGREVALSSERLEKLWGVYATDLRQRKIGDHCKELHIATRWSVRDVIGRLEEEYKGDPRVKFISLPAIDEDGNSNFDYKYGVGFDTKFYTEQQAIMDEIDWKALYMNQPIEREGLLYHKDELRRFFDLPDREPDAIIAVCDTKDKGKDYASLPVAYVYGKDYYIKDVLFNNSMPDVLDELMINILVDNKVNIARFESNSAGGRVAKDVHLGVLKKGGSTNITTKYTTQNKETKIIVHAKWVKDHCLFLDESQYKLGSDYAKFIDNLTSYTLVGKNAHDDAPDSMAMLSEFAQSMNSSRVEVIERPF